METRTFISGDSVTFGVLFDSGYDTDRIEDFSIIVGHFNIGGLSESVMIGSSYAVKVPSDDTFMYRGCYDVLVALTDSVMGVKHYKANKTVAFQKTGSNVSEPDTDDGVSFLIELDPLADASVTVATVPAIQFFEGHSPYIGEDGYWYTWDSNTQAYVKTDYLAGVVPDLHEITDADLDAEDHTWRVENATGSLYYSVTVRDNNGIERAIQNYPDPNDAGYIIFNFGRNIPETWKIKIY
jgi:hypothetical protein